MTESKPSLLDEYLRLLSTVDAWYGRVQKRFPSKINCRRGCFDCCLGLFDVTPLDAALLREGLETLPPETREDIRAGARETMAKIAAAEPRLAGAGDLSVLTDDEIDALTDKLGPIPCPVLGKDGECRLYDHRPMTCRLNGIPIVDLRGKVVHAEGCFKNDLAVGDAPASAIGLDVRAVKKEEARMIGELGDGEAGRFIAQALAAPPSVGT